MRAMPRRSTDRLPFTGDDEADRLLVAEPLALLIGFALDQQVTRPEGVLAGRSSCKRRIGQLDAARIAAMDPEPLDDGVPRRRRPCTASRASWPARSQALCAAIAERYGGDAGRVWTRGDGRRGPAGAAARRCPGSGR